MARITKGILGGFSGKVGTIVGANWRGQDIIRSLPKPSSRPPSEKQLLQQMKFKLVIAFLQPLKIIQTKYFGAANGSRSKVNMAASYTMSEATETVDGETRFIYNKVLITKGDLTGFQNPAVNPQSGQILRLTWEDNSMQGNAHASDKVNAVCYCEELNAFEIFEGIADRNALTADLTLSSLYSGKEVRVWMYLSKADEAIACTSPYLGIFTIS